MLNGSCLSRFAFLFAALAALAPAGCGGGGGPHGGTRTPPAGSDAYATFAWSIYDVGDTTALTCDEVAGAQFSISLIDSAGNRYDNVAWSACGSNQTDFVATTVQVPAGYYSVEFYLYGNTSVYTGSNVVIGSNRVDNVLLASGFTDFRGTPDAVYTQSFLVAWQLYSGSLLSDCNPGEVVELQFGRPNSSTLIFSDFACTQRSAYSFPIPLDYTSAQWSMSLLDAGGNMLDGIAGGIVQVPDGADINLGTQVFYVNH
jgi:hypothetical protein